MVETVLAAAARVLVKEGYEGATTNRIAETAGISVGSLYQYFPNKESIVAVLFERHSEKMWDVFVRETVALAGASLADAVTGVIDALWDAHGVDPRLHRVMHEQVPRIGQLHRQREINRRAREVTARFLAGCGEVKVRDLDTAAFVVVEAVEAMIHASVEEPGVDRRRVRDETVALLCAYLTASSPRR